MANTRARQPDETLVACVEEARKDALEVAQEADAPPQARAEDASTLTPVRLLPNGENRRPGSWKAAPSEHGSGCSRWAEISLRPEKGRWFEYRGRSRTNAHVRIAWDGRSVRTAPAREANPECPVSTARELANASGARAAVP